MSFFFSNNINNKFPPLVQALPMNDQALLKTASLILSGVLILWMTAQIRINLFFTPVPITGQTFGVLILSAAYGSRLGFMTVFSYLAVGIIGLPVFAGGASGWAYFTGATAGYLVGFGFAALFVGYLSEQGWDRKPLMVILSMMLGNVLIYFCGVSWLSYSLNINISKAISLGLEPFLVGDAVKILIAAGLLPGMWSLKSYLDNNK
jgi:biotin transport system substrate-specific component